MAGLEASMPMSFSATMTWAELETGSSSHAPWTTPRIRIFKKFIVQTPESRRCAAPASLVKRA